jgi:type II secretory pathway pseudopilin PulG
MPAAPQPTPPNARAFTLVETLISLAIFAAALLTLLGLLVTAADSTRSNLAVDAASALSPSIAHELASGDRFPQIYDALASSSPAPARLFTYSYRASPSNTRAADGSPVPHPEPGTPGSDYLLVTALRLADDPLLEDDLTALDGPLFRMPLQPLDPATLLPLPSLPDRSSFPHASLPCHATLLLVRSALHDDPLPDAALPATLRFSVDLAR